MAWCCLVLLGQKGECTGSSSSVTNHQRNGPVKDTLPAVMKEWSNANSVVVIVAVFAFLVVCAVFVGAAGRVSKTHAFGLVTGHEKRFGRSRGWL